VKMGGYFRGKSVISPLVYEVGKSKYSSGIIYYANPLQLSIVFYVIVKPY
jgi:hypothetical protein